MPPFRRNITLLKKKKMQRNVHKTALKLGDGGKQKLWSFFSTPSNIVPATNYCL